MRIVFAILTTQLLQIIGLTLAGGLLLLFVSYQMYREIRTQGQDEITPAAQPQSGSRRRSSSLPAGHHVLE